MSDLAVRDFVRDALCWPKADSSFNIATMLAWDRVEADDQVVSVLDAAGWKSDRLERVAHWSNSAKRGGFPDLPVAVEMWRRLGGLRFTPPMFATSKISSLRLEFDPLECSDLWVDCYERRARELGFGLAPLGFMDPDFHLLICADGSILADSKKTYLHFTGGLHVILRQLIVRESFPDEIRSDLAHLLG